MEVTRLNFRDWRNILLGTAVGVLGVRMSPQLRRAARPVTRTLIAGFMDISLQTKSSVARIMEEMENLVAEAQYERDQAAQAHPGQSPDPSGKKLSQDGTSASSTDASFPHD